MDKEVRQHKIISLIRVKRINTQTELAEYLERAGIYATQSSVSRDIEELGIIKRRGRYTLPQASNNTQRHGLLDLQAAGDALVVAKCEPGLASAIAVEIDRAALGEIAGTLAGEDTIFIAVRERKSLRDVIKKIWNLFS